MPFLLVPALEISFTAIAANDRTGTVAVAVVVMLLLPLLPLLLFLLLLLRFLLILSSLLMPFLAPILRRAREDRYVIGSIPANNYHVGMQSTSDSASLAHACSSGRQADQEGEPVDLSMGYA